MAVLTHKTVFLIFVIILMGFVPNQTKKANGLKQSSDVSLTTGSANDSVKNRYLMEQIKRSYKENDTVVFHKYRHGHLKFLHRYSDSISLAKNYEYSAAFFRKHHQLDSAYFYYFKEYQIHDALKDSLSAGESLLNLAILHKNVADYSGSENISFKALQYLEPSNNKRRLASVFNNLGIVYNNLKNHEKALEYHIKSQKIRDEINPNPILKVQSLNNIGKVYKDMGDYRTAVVYFQNALTNGDLLEQHKETKAALLDNLAHAQFKSGVSKKSLEQFMIALKIREEIEDMDGILINCIHLAEYYNSIGDKETAVQYVERAENVAIKTHEYRDYLEALRLMANLYDGDKAKEKFNKYASIRDSIDLINKRHKEQFSRIKYEVEEKEQIIQEERLSNQRNGYLIFILLFFAIFLLLGIFYFYNRKKKQELELRMLVEKLREAQQKFFYAQDKELKESSKIDFRNMLIKKYELTDTLIEFWELQSNGLTEAQVAKELTSVTEEAIKKRRNKLYKKLKDYHSHLDSVDKFMSVSIYREEFNDFVKKFDMGNPV